MTTKNGDLPAMANDIDSQTLSCLGLMPTVEAFYKHSAGLTKREYFAALAMQGVLSCGNNELSHVAAQRAVECADALLFELENSR